MYVLEGPVFPSSMPTVAAATNVFFLIIRFLHMQQEHAGHAQLM